jgi:hypothetical protein
MLAIRMPIDRRANPLIMCRDSLLRGLAIAEVPALDRAVVSAKGKLDGISRGPLDITDPDVHACKGRPALAS